MSIRKIRLAGKNRRYATIDSRDYKTVSQFKWHIRKSKCGNEYACASLKVGGKGTAITMSRIIMKAPKGIEVDHRNGRTLNNRRCNLRLATRSQNACNIKKKPGCASKYKGVHFDARYNHWVARIKLN